MTLREEYLAEGYSEEETAEFDRLETVDAIVLALLQLGHEVDRIGHAAGIGTPSRAGRSLGSGL